MPKIDYVTIISPVKETTLWGKADAPLWEDYLHAEDLSPLPDKGKVNLLLSSIDSHYMGFRFQEFSISIQLSEKTYFLAHAYNSIRLFALAERKFFQTPYYAGNLQVERDCILLNEGIDFAAKLNPRAPLLTQMQEDWELTIRLPKAFRKKANQPHFFYARLQGFTETYPADLSHFSMGGNERIFDLLRASQFQALEWRIRANAVHSKSKTIH